MVEPVAISAEALAAATIGPAPLTDAAVIAQLRQQLASNGDLILRLQEELRTRPVAAPGCVGCAGLRRTIADLERARDADRGLIARLQLAAPAERERTLTPPPAEAP